MDEYSKQARDAAAAAIKKVPYPAGGLIELEIHTHLEQVLGMDPMSDECFRIADEALSVAGILLGFGPDEL
jgi:hypothetical protein